MAIYLGFKLQRASSFKFPFDLMKLKPKKNNLRRLLIMHTLIELVERFKLGYLFQ